MSRKLKIILVVLLALVVFLSAFLAAYFLFNKKDKGVVVENNVPANNLSEAQVAPQEFSSLGLIKKDFDEGKISAAKYFSQKVAYVLGSPALDQKYITNASQSANEAISCGYSVFKEIDDYQQDPKSDPQAVETIKAFFNPKASLEYFEAQKTALAPKGLKFIEEAKAQTIDANTSGPSTCRYGSNYCRLPSEQLKNRVNGLFAFAKSTTAVPNDPFWDPNLNDMFLIKEMVNLDKCLCADAGSGNIIEIYYHSADDFVASRVQSYLETSKPWAQFKKQIYVRATPDPKPLYDVTSPDFLSKKDNPFAVYLLRTLADPGLMMPGTVTSNGVTHIGSAVLINPLKLEEQEFQVKDRQSNKTVVNQDSKILGTFIHETIHAFDYTQGKYNNFAQNPYFEGFTMAMERLIRPNLNHTLMADQLFYNKFLNKNLYTLVSDADDNSIYGPSMIFRYIASLTGGDAPLAGYLKKLATRDGKEILFSDYLSQYGARFAVSNLNIDYPNIGENIYQYKKSDASFPDGFSAPRYDGAVVNTGMIIDTSDKKEIKNLVVGPGQVRYQMINYLGNRTDHRYIEINHAPFTSGPNRQLGVLLLDVDKEIGNNETDYDKYILGDGASNISAVKYYEFKSGDEKSKICLEDGSVRPNVMILIFANNDKSNRADILGAPMEIITKTSCEPELGNYIKINGSAVTYRGGSLVGGMCGTATSGEEVKDYKATLYDLVFEEEEKATTDEEKTLGINDGLGSASGILTAFRLIGGKANFSTETKYIDTMPCYDAQGHCMAPDVLNYIETNLGNDISFQVPRGYTGSGPGGGDEYAYPSARLVLYKNGKYTFTMAGISVAGGKRNVNASAGGCGFSESMRRSETSIGSFDGIHIWRDYGSFVDGATEAQGNKLLSFSAGLTKGKMNTQWKIKFPPMKHCTIENNCLDPNKPKPVPPKYWDLPPFCLSDDGLGQCTLWQAQVFKKVGAYQPSSLNDMMRDLNKILPQMQVPSQ